MTSRCSRSSQLTNARRSGTAEAHTKSVTSAADAVLGPYGLDVNAAPGRERCECAHLIRVAITIGLFDVLYHLEVDEFVLPSIGGTPREQNSCTLGVYVSTNCWPRVP